MAMSGLERAGLGPTYAPGSRGYAKQATNNLRRLAKKASPGFFERAKPKIGGVFEPFGRTHTATQMAGAFADSLAGNRTGNRVGDAYENIRRQQDQARNKQLSAVDRLRQMLEDDAFSQQLQGAVGGQLEDPSGAYADARNRELNAQIGNINTQAQARQEQINEQLGARGLSRSGLNVEEINDLERSRQGTVASAGRAAAMDIAAQEAGARQGAIGQAMQYQGLRSNVGNNLLSQQGAVLGGTQYTPVPTPPQPQAEQAAITNLRRQIDQLRGQRENVQQAMAPDEPEWGEVLQRYPEPSQGDYPNTPQGYQRWLQDKEAQRRRRQAAMQGDGLAYGEQAYPDQLEFA